MRSSFTSCFGKQTLSTLKFPVLFTFVSWLGWLNQTACYVTFYRLGFFLFTRVMQDGHDRRFNKIKHDPKMFFVAWTMQGLFDAINIKNPWYCHYYPRHFYWDVRIGYEFYWSFGPGFCICMCTEHKINVQAIFISSLIRLLASHYSYSSIRCYYSGMVVRKPMLNLMWDLRTQLAPSYDQLGRRTLSINR